MFLLVKEIDDERIIIGTAQKKISADSAEKSGITVYEISDAEYTPDMIHTKIESFEEDV